MKDNTQRKKMEADLRQSEERYRALFENSSEAIIIIDGSTIIDCNQRTLGLFNLASRDQLKFRSDAEFFPPTQQNGQDSSEFARDKLKATYAGDTQSFEWTHVKLDGDTIHVEVNLSEVRLGEKSVIQANIRDITRRRKVEEALVDLNSTLEERVEERTDELEKAYAELLQKNVQFRELAKRLSHAEEQERRRIARLLHDNHQQLLVAAKIRVEMLQGDSYNSDVNNAAGQVLEILDQAVEVTRSLTMELAPPILYGSGLTVAMQWLARWMKEEHQLEVILQGSVPATRISTEMSHVLFRAVRELLFNVIKHSGVKQAHLKISLVDQQLLLTVVDEGAGFNVADTLESAVSYGLFSIEEQLVAFEGRLDISSTPKSGTTCTISIPISTAKALDSEDLQSGDNFVTDPTISLQARRGSIRIMVVDDHLVARSALVQILTLMEDFDVVGEAVDGLDAIEKARTLMPDVILMDVSMPRMDGVEATRAITTEMSGVKIIGLSMHSAEEMEPQMLAVGAMGYLQKHTPVETLLATVRSVMKNSGAATSAGHDG